MQLHYSTVNPAEQRESIGEVISLMQGRAERAGGAPNAPRPDGRATPGKRRNALQLAATPGPEDRSP
jgi:hypothetical protein